MVDFLRFCLIRKYTKYSLNLTFGGEYNDTPSLRRGETHVEYYGVRKRESFSGAVGGARETYQIDRKSVV